MFLREFYTTVVTKEEQCVQYLMADQLLLQTAAPDLCHHCGGKTKRKRKRDRGGEFHPAPRCTGRGCQIRRSVIWENVFFHSTDLNGSQLPTNVLDIRNITHKAYILT